MRSGRRSTRDATTVTCCLPYTPTQPRLRTRSVTPSHHPVPKPTVGTYTTDPPPTPTHRVHRREQVAWPSRRRHRRYYRHRHRHRHRRRRRHRRPGHRFTASCATLQPASDNRIPPPTHHTTRTLRNTLRGRSKKNGNRNGNGHGSFTTWS